MDRIVYFADKAVSFTRQAPGPCWHVVVPESKQHMSRAKVTKILETHNCVALVAADPEEAFKAFAAEFTLVEAAGGVVVNDCGQWLMIHRGGRWDFPKGHVESCEQLEVCAAREVAEETGVVADVIRPLCRTLHAYYFEKTARWELKRTHWYELHTPACDTLAPQTEEGIEDVVWCSPEEVAANLAGTFPTIRCVAAAMKMTIPTEIEL